MILGMLTAACVVWFLIVALIKFWNLYHKAEKMPWWGTVILWAFSGVVLSGLLVGVDINNALVYQDSSYGPDLQEAIYFFQFGFVAMGIITLLTLGEVVLATGAVVSQGFGKPRGDK